jgi:hypothetical protein
MKFLVDNKSWAKSSPQIFWAEIAPNEHVVQIYENDVSFLNLLTDFVIDGIKTNDCVVIIATKIHRAALSERLLNEGYSLAILTTRTQLIMLDAEETLSKFMVKDWPEEILFNQTISAVITKAKSNGRKVRAFGEMVAILWAKGHVGATVRLEHLWNKFCENEEFCLFCAYPQSGFTQDASTSIMHICSAHSKMISNSLQDERSAEIFYRQVEPKADSRSASAGVAG